MAEMIQTVFVAQKGHCNQDSLPLRFGFFFSKDSTLKIKLLSVPKPNKHGDNRRVFEGEIELPDQHEFISGTFVVADNEGKRYPSLVTAWRHDENAEFYLSEVLKSLRASGTISQEWLCSKHDLYRSGQLRTHTDLVNLLATELSESEVNVIKSNLESVIAGLELELDRVNSLAAQKEKLAASEKKRADEAEQAAEKEKERADTNEKWAKALEAEVERYKREEQTAQSSGNLINTTEPDQLVSVDENVIYNNSSCTRLTLANGDLWYMKTSTFDLDGSVTRKAKKLIGYRVKVTSWDPVAEPGKWSSRWYFRNLYLVR